MCSKTKITVTTHKNWKNQKLSVRSQTIEKLSRSECLALYISKNCERQLMTGTNNYYKSILEPEVEYSYFGPPRIFVSYHRHVFKRHIVGSSLTQPLYLNADSRCWPEDLYCQIQENILIWENDIIQKCPFFFIRQIPVTIIGNIIIGDNLLFQITNKQQACDVHIMSTTEGIYISLDLRATQLKTSNIELDMKTHFMLAEIDFRIESILRIFDKLNNKIETQICTIIKDKLMHMENYTFISLNNKNNIDRVLLKDNGELIVTNCVPITTITIATTNKYCYKHIPVSFMYNNNTLNGFLRENNLLTLESQVIDCNIKTIIEL
jgi:hypothetical protein